MKIKARKIKYCPDSEQPGRKLPSAVTVEADPDFFDCMVEPGESEGLVFDNLEISEYVGELIEAKVGEPVVFFEWRF